jgi:Lamin Tail Domain
MNIKPIHYLSLIAVFWLNACGAAGSIATNKAAILPSVCQVQVGQQIALTLDGQIPANVSIQWNATIGDVVWTGQGLAATFLAPNIPGDAVISVSFVSGTPTPYTTERICSVLTAETALPPSAPSDPSTSTRFTIAISEVMGNPCGGLDYKKFNQYVELYNYGDQPVDVGGWWLFDEGEKGTPDQLVAWSTRSQVNMDSSLITNTTVIPARAFAVILSPIYPENNIEHRMPYHFPSGTILLTAGSSQTLGDDFFGIISSENGYDTLTLYIGGETVIDTVVDTYGTPKIDSLHPVDIDDDYLDNVPFYLGDCKSAERVNPRLPDSETNWVAVYGGSPGDGPYQ